MLDILVYLSSLFYYFKNETMSDCLSFNHAKTASRFYKKFARIWLVFPGLTAVTVVVHIFKMATVCMAVLLQSLNL